MIYNYILFQIKVMLKEKENILKVEIIKVELIQI